jgi:5-formyltetrahydrofolate cyclo-ligase
MATKSELRKTYREKRKHLSAQQIEANSRVIADLLFAEFDFAKLSVVHCFISIAKFNEVDTSIIFERIWDEFPNVRTAVPRVDGSTGELEHFYYDRDTNMVKNAWGIEEPSGAERVDPKEIDLVVVPLLCFDERGYRVGYGKGYYDRFLRECRSDCITAGLSFFPPEIEIKDVHDGDFALEMFIMPNGIFRPE